MSRNRMLRRRWPARSLSNRGRLPLFAALRTSSRNCESYSNRAIEPAAAAACRLLARWALASATSRASPGQWRPERWRHFVFRGETMTDLDRGVERSIEYAVFGGPQGRREFIARVGAGAATAALGQ